MFGKEGSCPLEFMFTKDPNEIMNMKINCLKCRFSDTQPKLECKTRFCVSSYTVSPFSLVAC